MRDSVVLTFLIFCAILLFYPEQSDTKSFTRADEVMFSNGMTVEEARDKFTLRTTVVPDSDNYNYKVNLGGYRALVSVYCSRLHQSANVQKYIINENGVFCYLNYTADLGIGGLPIAVTPSATSDPKVWNINITNCSGTVVLIERQIIK